MKKIVKVKFEIAVHCYEEDIERAKDFICEDLFQTVVKDNTARGWIEVDSPDEDATVDHFMEDEEEDW